MPARPARNDAALDFLLSRRSRPAKTLVAPAPTRKELLPILTAAARTPDHGKLEPWRFIVVEKPAMARLADAVAAKLGELEPASAETFRSNADAFKASLGGMEDKLAGIKASAGAAPVAVTEPVPLYLLEAAGLENQTPEEYTASIEEGADVPPAVLKATTDLMNSGSIRLLAYNQQTEGPQTVDVKDAATAAGVPVVDFSETLPEGKSYVQWMTGNVDNIGKALA